MDSFGHSYTANVTLWNVPYVFNLCGLHLITIEYPRINTVESESEL